MALRLADGVHAVQVGSDLVLLSPEDDAYFCLSLDEGALAVESGRLVAHAPGLAEALCASGLITVASGKAPDCGTIPPAIPTRSARRLIEDQGPLLGYRPGWPQISALARASLAASRRRRLAMKDLVRVAGRPVEAAPSARLLADLDLYRRLTPWLPIDGLCLFRSSMLLQYLTALGHGARWVFGVRTWPFRAHCWLQVGDVVLDDEAERLVAYAPIMAV